MRHLLLCMLQREACSSRQQVYEQLGALNKAGNSRAGLQHDHRAACKQLHNRSRTTLASMLASLRERMA